MPLDALGPARQHSTVSFQRGGASLPVEVLPDPLSDTMDIVATARWVAALDRIVTVDTMIARRLRRQTIPGDLQSVVSALNGD